MNLRTCMLLIVLLLSPSLAQEITGDVIGFGVSAAAEAQLQAIAEAAGGQYFGANDQASLTQALSQAVQGTTLLTQEREPNSLWSEANTIAATGKLSGAISPVGDSDWYGLTVPQQGLLDVHISAMIAGFDMSFRLVNADFEVISGWHNSYDGAENKLRISLLEAGSYYLQLAENGSNNASPEGYQLSTSYFAGDALEVNNKLSSASPIVFSAPLEATINPVGDSDWYRFEAPQQGLLDVAITELPEDFDMSFRIVDADFVSVIGWQNSYGGANNKARVSIPRAGTFYLQLAENGSNHASEEAYTLALDFFVGDSMESNNLASQATIIELNNNQLASINPVGDSDWYRFVVSQQGLWDIDIDVPDDFDLSFRILNQDFESHIGWQNAYGGASNKARVSFLEPDVYYLQIAENGSNHALPDMYQLNTSFYPGDALEPNNRLRQASSISLNSSLEASINPVGDSDWYALNSSSQGTLEVRITDLPENFDMSFRVLDANLQTIQGWTNSYGGANNNASISLPAAGRYYLQLAENGSNHASEESYSLSVSFSP